MLIYSHMTNYNFIMTFMGGSRPSNVLLFLLVTKLIGVNQGVTVAKKMRISWHFKKNSWWYFALGWYYQNLWVWPIGWPLSSLRFVNEGFAFFISVGEFQLLRKLINSLHFWCDFCSEMAHSKCMSSADWLCHHWDLLLFSWSFRCLSMEWGIQCRLMMYLASP